MVTHTLVLSFPDAMSEVDRKRFFAEGAEVVLSSGIAESYQYWPGVRVPSAVDASTFAASALVQIRCASAELLQRLFAHPPLGEYARRWRSQFPFQVVAINTEDQPGQSDAR